MGKRKMALDGFTIVGGKASVSGDNKTVVIDQGTGSQYGEVITSLLLCEQAEFFVRVECLQSPSALTVGVFAPDVSHHFTVHGPDEVDTRVSGTIWGWNLHTHSIYRKRRDLNACSNWPKQIMPFSGDAPTVTSGSIIGVFRDINSKTIHFSVNGRDQGIKLNHVPRYVHGFLRLLASGRDSQIGVTLLPGEPPNLITPRLDVPLPCTLLFRLYRKLKTNSRGNDERGREVGHSLPSGLPRSTEIPVPSVPSRGKTAAIHSSSGQFTPGSATCTLSNSWTTIQSPPVFVYPGATADVPQLCRYDMSKCPRGICLIINNHIFGNGNMNREGAEYDEGALKDLFTSLFFTVHIKRNLQKRDMEILAEKYARKNHSKYCAFVFIVMSHGADGDVIYGVEGKKARMEDLMWEFLPSHCVSLKNKPKLFIVQSCRGNSGDQLAGSIKSTPDQFVISFDSDTISCSPDSTISRSVCPPGSDFLLACATTPGYKAWRRPESGSLFIQAFVKVIRTHHEHHHLLDMLTEVNRQVAEEQNHIQLDVEQRCQVPAPIHTLRAQVFL